VRLGGALEVHEVPDLGGFCGRRFFRFFRKSGRSRNMRAREESYISNSLKERRNANPAAKASMRNPTLQR
jgi:hypothetical protein